MITVKILSLKVKTHGISSAQFVFRSVIGTNTDYCTFQTCSAADTANIVYVSVSKYYRQANVSQTVIGTMYSAIY